MSAITPTLALVGRSFPSNDFEELYKASVAARGAKRPSRAVASHAFRARAQWFGSGQPITTTLRLAKS